MTAQQIANNLAAAEQERAHIRELERELANAKNANEKSVLKYRIKISKDFLRKYMLNAQALERSL